MIFVTSDQHLFHKNILSIKKRPFGSIEEMHQVIVSQWNQRVNPDDIVYVLGDFKGKESCNGKDILSLASSLHGQKILIKGNHDSNYPMKQIFSEVYSSGNVQHIEFDGTTFFFNHYLANMTVEGDFPDVLYLHGHSHNRIAYNVLNAYLQRPYYDVGVDANGFAPISLEAIKKLFQSPPEKLPNFTCKQCGAKMTLHSGEYGRFLGCNNYPRCSFTVNMEVDRRSATEKRKYLTKAKK